MSKLSVLLICCIFATLSLLVNCSPTASSSTTIDNNNNNQTDTEIRQTRQIQFQRHERQKRSGCNRPAKAHLFPFVDFKNGSGSMKTYDSAKDGSCMDLPQNWVESINTLDTCVRIYINNACTGTHVVLEPNTDFHRDVRKLFVSPLHKEGISPSSIGTCG